jgi:hypothetical protein
MNQMTRRNLRWLQGDVFGSADHSFLWPVLRLHQEMNRLLVDRGAEERTAPGPH